MRGKAGQRGEYVALCNIPCKNQASFRARHAAAIDG
jgi:hypothetical protein